MRAVVQRVSKASVTVDGELISSIGKGLLVLAGAGIDDTIQDAQYIRNKVVGLRIFEDDAGKMNLSVEDIGGELLIVSQFTLYGDARKGRRPSFGAAMPPERAKEFFDEFVSLFEDTNLTVKTGIFGAMMQVELVNDGPVTILLDSSRSF